MKVCFLGTSSAIPYAGNGYTSFLLENAGRLVLIDTGDNAVKSILEAGRDPMLLDALVLTHEHADHLGGLPSLIAALDCMKRGKKLVVIASPRLRMKALTLLSLFDIIEDKLSFELEFVTQWQTDDAHIELLAGNHSAETMMPRFSGTDEALLYTADIRYKAGQYMPYADTCQTLIHEATYANSSLPLDTGHSSALQAGMAASEIGAKRLFLCHFQNDAYESVDAPRLEAARSFGGEIIIPRLLRWYSIKERAK